jgi:plastocyanin
MVAVAFGSIAVAQSSSDQYSSTDQYAPEQTQSPTTNGQAAPDQNAVTVSIHDHAFDPALLVIPKETTVTWVNNDTEAHTVTADNGLFDSGALQPGESFSIWLSGSGTVPYHCEIHPDMKGSVTVGGASGGETTSPEQTTSSPEQTTGTTEQTTQTSMTS